MLKKKKDPASESSQSNDTLRMLWSVKYLHLSFVFNLFALQVTQTGPICIRRVIVMCRK